VWHDRWERKIIVWARSHNWGLRKKERLTKWYTALIEKHDLQKNWIKKNKLVMKRLKKKIKNVSEIMYLFWKSKKDANVGKTLKLQLIMYIIKIRDSVVKKY
jgi:hypothetical protein